MRRNSYSEKQQLELFKRLLHLKKTKLIIQAFSKETGYSIKYAEARYRKYRKEGKLEAGIRTWGKLPRKATAELPDDYDEFSDKLMARLELAKQAEMLKAELKKYKTGYENMKGRAADLEKQLKEIEQRKLRYKQARQQGDINEPLGGPQNE